MRVDESIDAVAELAFRLYHYMGIPIAAFLPGDGSPGQTVAGQAQPLRTPGPERGGIERLRKEVWELGQDAARIGRVPSGYPRHIDWMMKVISALLPWYTRNLVQFGQRTVQTVQAMADALEELLRKQDSLMAQLDRRREARLPPQGESRTLGGSSPARFDAAARL